MLYVNRSYPNWSSRPERMDPFDYQNPHPQSPRSQAAQMRRFAATIHRKPCPYPDHRGLPPTLFASSPRRRHAPEAMAAAPLAHAERHVRTSGSSGSGSSSSNARRKPGIPDYFYSCHELAEIVAELHHANNRRAAQPVKTHAHSSRHAAPSTSSSSSASAPKPPHAPCAREPEHSKPPSAPKPTPPPPPPPKPKPTTDGEKVPIEDIQRFILQFQTYRNRNRKK